MSTSTTQNFNTTRIRNRTLDTLVKIASRYEQKAETTPSVAYDERFWNALQRDLQQHVSKARRVALAGNYTQLAAYLRDLKHYGIRLAIDRARNRVDNDDPFLIQTDDFWQDIYDDITDFETNTADITA